MWSGCTGSNGWASSTLGQGFCSNPRSKVISNECSYIYANLISLSFLLLYVHLQPLQTEVVYGRRNLEGRLIDRSLSGPFFLLEVHLFFLALVV
jgi:hypothetical protein